MSSRLLPPGPEARELERAAAALPVIVLDAPGLAALELLLDGALAPMTGFSLDTGQDLPDLPLTLPVEDTAPGERFALHDPEGVTLGVMAVSAIQRRPDGTVAGGAVQGLRMPERNLFVKQRLALSAVVDALCASGLPERICVSLRGVPEPAEAASIAQLGASTSVLLRVMDPGDADQAHHVKQRLDAALAMQRSLGSGRSVVSVCPDPHPLAGPSRDALDSVYARNAGCARALSIGHAHAAAPMVPGGGVCVFFTGLSGSGKSTVARALHAHLVEHTGRAVTLLDGDVVRRHLSRGLGFSRADRDVNVARIGYVASRVVMHAGTAICAPIAPYAATRAAVREMVQAHGRFIEVHVATPLAVCEARDRKGLYARARAGAIKEFTGISDPYEVPAAPELQMDTSEISLEEAVRRVAALIH